MVLYSVFKDVLVLYSVFKGVLVLYSVFKGVLVLYSAFKRVLVIFSVLNCVLVIFRSFLSTAEHLEGEAVRLRREQVRQHRHVPVASVHERVRRHRVRAAREALEDGRQLGALLRRPVRQRVTRARREKKG